jgi:hypothetical protein
MTEEKLEANRNNAQLSTGPRTPTGKLAVSLNAVKHGILAKEIIKSGEILGESPEDFEALLSGLIEVYKPVGKAEELAVEEIAVSYVRRARTLRAEGTAIMHGLDELHAREYENFLEGSPIRGWLLEQRMGSALPIGGSLPPAEVLDHTIRYEALLDRQMMRAVQWLEMLQQGRRSAECREAELRNKPKSE